MEKTELLNEPIFWEGTLEDLKKQKFDGKQRISFLCENCGQLHEICFRRAKKIDKLWCQSCKFKEVRGRDTELGKQIQAKTRKTNMERYGVPNTSMLPEVQEKVRKTNRERYGVDSFTQTPEYIEKTKETNIKKYGVEWSFQSEEVKEKGRQTLLEKYGVDAPSRSPEIRAKAEQTCIEKYGVPNVFKNPVFVEKAKQTSLERYGVDNYAKTEECKEKMKQTCLERYEEEYFSKSDESKEMQKQQFLEKYGVPSFSQFHFTPETREILFNKDNLVNFIEAQEDKSIDHLSKLLGVCDTTLRKYIHEYGLAEKYLYQTEVSRYEIEIKELLNSLNIEYLHNRKDIIPPLELDIYIPSKNIAIEFDGNYWHSTDIKPLNYHNLKSTKCEEKEIRLIHIFEYEWNSNSEKIKNYLKDILSNRNLISAEDCIVKEISFNQAKNFINKYSLKEYQPSSIRIGLFKEDKLLEVMTFSKSKSNETYDYNVTNIAAKSGYKIENGYKKIFQYFEENYKPLNVVAFCDRCKYTGDLFKKLNFNFERISEENYVWVNSYRSEVFSKYDYKNKFEKEDIQYLGEDLYMRSIGLLKIYDAGNFVFRKEYN